MEEIKTQQIKSVVNKNLKLNLHELHLQKIQILTERYKSIIKKYLEKTIKAVTRENLNLFELLWCRTNKRLVRKKDIFLSSFNIFSVIKQIKSLVYCTRIQNKISLI